MVAPSKIRVMISSRCNDEIAFRGKKSNFSEVRRELKNKLEKVELFGSKLFDVWINEDGVPAEGSVDAWDHCMDQVKRADAVIVLYNGNAGWCKNEGAIGICHAELESAMQSAPAKVRIIEVAPIDEKLEKIAYHKLFQNYYGSCSRFRGATVSNGEQIIARVEQALREVVPDMVHLGLREAKKGKFAFGESLDWSKLDFSERSKRICKIISDSLSKSLKGKVEESSVIGQLGTVQITFKCHGVPGSMSEPAAREYVGQPFVRDHEYFKDKLEKPPIAGPIHIIGCHRNVTETQASKLLGLADATIISPSFGVFLVDPVSKIQIVLIGNCRDETSTRDGVQRFLDWLEQTGEKQLVVQRAKSRAKILKVIASEM